MKEQRLKALNDCLSVIQEAHDVLEDVRDEEQDAYATCQKACNIANEVI